MSLLDLRDRYVIPAINEREIELGTLLYSSLDSDIDSGVIKQQQDQLAGLVALKEFINQNLQQTNDTDRLKQFYSEARRYGLDVEYRERKAIYVDTDTKTTKLQSVRKASKASKALKPKAKPKIKPKAQTHSDPEPEPAAAAAPVAPKKKLKVPLKKLKAPKKQVEYKWKTDTYAPAGTTTNLTVNNVKFKLAILNKSPDVIDAVINAITLLRDQGQSPSEQVSNVAALEQVLPSGTVTPDMVSLHNKLKALVVEE